MSPDRNRAEALLGQLGFEAFRPGQREAVEAALAGRDSLIVMPTGGGKSLCYQLPGLASPDLTIVVSPLIALIVDQWKRLTAAGHPVAMVTSAMEAEDVRRALAQVRGGEARMVYCSPERFGSSFFLEAIAQRRIDLLAVDEAHCVSEWGHDFRPDYLRLPQIAERLGRPTVMACTATATEAVGREIAARFGMREPLQVRSGFDRPNLSFDVVRLEGKGSKARRLALLEAGLADAANRPAIVYCGTRKDTDELAATLRDGGLRAVRYHAGMEAEERGAAQHRFMAGEVDVVVATNAFGMGVDKADVRSVWHMAIPTSLEAYYQEAGRAGRDGLPARAVLLAMKTDLGRLVRFNQQRAGDPELAIAHERGWRDYRTIKSFIYSDRCRRRSVLDHFGDGTAGQPLGRCCDACDPESWLPDPETIAVRPTRRARSSAAAAPAAELSAGDARLFEELKAWRLRAADGKPAFTVAHNSTLETIAATRPGDPDALLAIKGVGPSFVAKYSAEVLAIVAKGMRHAALLAIAILSLAVLAAAPEARADALIPPGKKVYFGISDTGDPADFGEFSRVMNKHPALVQTFRTWGSDFPDSIERWQDARARPVIHITTADNNDGHELLSPRAIAQGHGDGYLIRLNKLFWKKKMPAYVRPLGEPNRCLNVYAAYDCEGGARGSAHSPRNYKRAFRRIYVIVKGGGKRAEIDARLAQAGLPSLNADVSGLPEAPVAVMWSVLPAGSPTVPQNRPRHFYPGSRWVDWVGTDIYSDNQDWKALKGLYRRFSGKPFALPEWGVVGADDPTFVRRLLGWVDRHRRCKMLVYYQDFGSSSPYRLQNHPASLRVLRRWLHHPRIPHFAPNPPHKPPPPKGGVGVRPR